MPCGCVQVAIIGTRIEAAPMFLIMERRMGWLTPLFAIGCSEETGGSMAGRTALYRPR